MKTDLSGMPENQVLTVTYGDLKNILRVAISSRTEEKRKKLISYTEAMERLNCKGSKFRELLNDPYTELIPGAIKGTVLESSVDLEIDRLCSL